MWLYQGEILVRTHFHTCRVAKVSNFFFSYWGCRKGFFVLFSYLLVFLTFSCQLSHIRVFFCFVFVCVYVCVCVRARAFLLSFFNNPIWLLYILQLASCALFCNIVNTMTINNKGFGKRIVRSVCRFSSSRKSDYILFIYLIDVQE